MNVDQAVHAAFGRLVTDEPSSRLEWNRIEAAIDRSSRRRIMAVAAATMATIAVVFAVPRVMSRVPRGDTVVPASSPASVVRAPKVALATVLPSPEPSAVPAKVAHVAEALGVAPWRDDGDGVDIGQSSGYSWRVDARVAAGEDYGPLCAGAPGCVEVVMTRGTQSASLVSSDVPSNEATIDDLVLRGLPGSPKGGWSFAFGAVGPDVESVRIEFLAGEPVTVRTKAIPDTGVKYFLGEFPIASHACTLIALDGQGNELGRNDEPCRSES